MFRDLHYVCESTLYILQIRLIFVMLQTLACSIPYPPRIIPASFADGVRDLWEVEAGSARRGKGGRCQPRRRPPRRVGRQRLIGCHNLSAWHTKPECLLEVVVFACNNLTVDHQLRDNVEVVTVANVDADV